MSFRDINLRTVGRPANDSPHHHVNSNKRKSKDRSSSRGGTRSCHQRLQSAPQFDISLSPGSPSYLPQQYVTPMHTPDRPAKTSRGRTRNRSKNSKHDMAIPVVIGKPVVACDRRKRIAPTSRYPMDEPAIVVDNDASSVALLDRDLSDSSDEQEYNIYDLSIAPPLQPVASNLTRMTCTSSTYASSDATSIGDSSTERSAPRSRRRTSLPSRPRARTTSPERRPQSAFAKLSEEIINFQKLVSELEQLLVPSEHSPEAQWRARILIRSAKDADRDIWKRLYEYEYQNRHDASRIQMACRKLHRDFSRTHKHLSSVVETYDQRQQVQVSFLSSTGLVENSQHSSSGNLNQSFNSTQKQQQQQQQSQQQQRQEKLVQEQEEFFDRAMREREAEISDVNRSMHTVHQIYQDLAGLVDDQQEKIDQIENSIRDARGDAALGSEEIRNMKNSKFQQAKRSIGEMFSGVGAMGYGCDGCAPTAVKEEEEPAADSAFAWVTPQLEAMGSDMRLFRQGVMEFTRDLRDLLESNVEDIRHPGGGCPSLNRNDPTCSQDERDPSSSEKAQ